MYKPSNRKYFLSKAMLAAGALLPFVSHTQAQSADALIDKLVSKGILTEKEAQDLRDDSDKNFTTAVQSKLGMPDWISGYKISGDFRGRYEHFSSDNAGFSLYERYRYRLRFGITVSMLDNLELGFRLGSGDPKGTAGNPLSQNSTFQGNFSDKNIYIDTAYGKWTPVNSGGWLASLTVGKMDNPFAYTWMVFDPDLTPEGAVARTSWQINDKQSLSLAGGAFILNAGTFNSLNSPRIPAFFGGQFLWNAQWTDKLATTLGGGGFKLVNSDQLTTANVPLINQGNTRQVTSAPITGDDLYSLQYQYAPVILDASATYTLDSFPLYKGQFPIKVGAEFMQNTEVSQNNQGFWLGVTFGKSGTKGSWDITYRYERLEADAWYDQLVDDDNGAFYPGDRLTGISSSVPFGYYGGTNVKGHMIKFNYSFTDSFTFTLTCYINDLINHDGLVANSLVPDTRTSSMIHLMADVSWAF